MDIESEIAQKKQKLLPCRNGSISLTHCRWRVPTLHNKKKKDLAQLPTHGYVHAAQAIKQNLYILLTPEQQQANTLLMYSYSFKKQQWKEWKDCIIPSHRDSFSLSAYKNQLYLFGGSDNDIHFNDLHHFNLFNSSWTQIQTKNAPSPRNPMIFLNYFDDCMLLVGGTNFKDKCIYNDAYLYKQNEWTKLSIINGPQNLSGAIATICGQTIVLYGGQITKNNVSHPNIVTYQLILNQSNLTIQFKQIQIQGHHSPIPRSGHSFLGVSQQYAFLVGGTGISQANSTTLFRDIWLLDIVEKTWTKVDPTNGPIGGFTEASLIFRNGTLILLGGRANNIDTWNDQLCLIQFADFGPFKSQACSGCQARISEKDKEDKSFPRKIVASLGLFYSLSLEINHPFQAIGLLHQCATIMKANKFRISVIPALNQSECLKVEWNGQKLSKQQFQTFVSHGSTSNQKMVRLMNCLKLGSFRLGKTVVFVNSSQTQRLVCMLSADSKVSPEFDSTYTFFAYVQNKSKNRIQSHEGKLNKDIIINTMKAKMLNVENLLNITNGSCIYIFQKNILITFQKTYYYQLINSSISDITVYRNIKKIQFLDQLGYNLSKEPQISLDSYFSLSFLAPPTTKIYINKSEQPVAPINYKNILESRLKKGQISLIQLPTKIGQVQIQSLFYKTQQPKLIQSNYGILIYYNGKLVNRLDTNFGDLFKQQFYKSKFKKASTIYQFLGIIDIKTGLSLNYVGTWFKKNKNYYSFLQALRQAMKINEKVKQKQAMSEEIEERRGNKKIKL